MLEDYRAGLGTLEHRPARRTHRQRTPHGRRHPRPARRRADDLGDRPPGRRQHCRPGVAGQVDAQVRNGAVPRLAEHLGVRRVVVLPGGPPVETASRTGKVLRELTHSPLRTGGRPIGPGLGERRDGSNHPPAHRHRVRAACRRSSRPRVGRRQGWRGATGGSFTLSSGSGVVVPATPATPGGPHVVLLVATDRLFHRCTPEAGRRAHSGARTPRSGAPRAPEPRIPFLRDAHQGPCARPARRRSATAR